MKHTLLGELSGMVRELVGMVAVALVPRRDISEEMVRAVRSSHGGLRMIASTPAISSSTVADSRETFRLALVSLLQVLFEIETTDKAIRAGVKQCNQPRFDIDVWVPVVQAVCEQIRTCDEEPLDAQVGVLLSVPALWESYQARCAYFAERSYHLIQQLRDAGDDGTVSLGN